MTSGEAGPSSSGDGTLSLLPVGHTVTKAPSVFLEQQHNGTSQGLTKIRTVRQASLPLPLPAGIEIMLMKLISAAKIF